MGTSGVMITLRVPAFVAPAGIAGVEKVATPFLSFDVDTPMEGKIVVCNTNSIDRHTPLFLTLMNKGKAMNDLTSLSKVQKQMTFEEGRSRKMDPYLPRHHIQHQQVTH
jgi:hypothetical protein